MPTLDYASPPPPAKRAVPTPDRVGRLVTAIGFFQGLPLVIDLACRLLYPRDFRNEPTSPSQIAFFAWCATSSLLLIATGRRIRKKPTRTAINLAMIAIVPLAAALVVMLWILIADILQFPDDSKGDFFATIFALLALGAAVIVAIAGIMLLRLGKAQINPRLKSASNQ
jgi:phosphatidylserine synthase